MRWYRRYIEPLAATYKLDPDLVEAFILIESSGKAHAYKFEPAFWDKYLADNVKYNRREPARVSASYGLMQVMYPTAVDYGFQGEPELLFVPQINIDVGCSIVADLLKWSNGDLSMAVAAYNGGRGNYTADYPQRYAAALIQRYHQMKDDGGVNA